MTRPAREVGQVLFGEQLTAFRRRVETANVSGNLEGFFARHVLGDSTQILWHVDPEFGSWLETNTNRLEDAPTLAALGYIVTARLASLAAAADILAAGLERLMGRDPYPGDRVTPMYSASNLIGLRLAGHAIQDRVPEFLPWLRATFDHPLREPNDPWIDLLHRHVLAELTGEPAELPRLASLPDHALAAAFYLLAVGTGTARETPDEVRTAQQRAMHVFLGLDPAESDVRQAVLWLHFAESVAAASADQLVVSVPQVSQVLRRFPSAMRRWRWDPDQHRDPIRWRIDAEREVQDVLWLMLRAVFDDVVDEESLPKLGHSSYRADFALPRLGLLIEVKYVRTRSDFKDVEQQVMIDAIGYLKSTDRYREIIVLIYDDSCSTEHHDQTRRLLCDLPGIADVIIVSRPGVLPEANKRKTAITSGAGLSKVESATGSE